MTTEQTERDTGELPAEQGAFVNRIARALAAHEGYDDWSVLTEWAQRQYIENVRVMIDAMRFPRDEDFNGKFGRSPRLLFTEMIDEALGGS